MRINFIASLVNNSNIVVDIGSDHAKLSKLLIDEKRSKKVINIENNNGPLENSIRSTKNNRYYNKIINIKSNGLDEISTTFFIDVCIIAGMGGKKIISILNKSKNHKIKKIILQPNNNINLIRKWCRNNFLRISKEYLIEENNIIYEILVISKNIGYIPLSFKSITFGKINVNNKNELFYKKWKNELNYLQKNKNIYGKNKKIIKIIKKIIE